MIRRLIISTLSVLGLVVGGFALQVAAPAASLVAPQKAAACAHGGDYCEINFKNTHAKTIVVCRDWTETYGDGVNQKGTCKYTSDGGARKSLYNGWKSGYADTGARVLSYGNKNFGWDDTDGFHVNSGYNARVKTDNGMYFWFRGTGWNKKGGCSDCMADLYHYAQ